MTANQWGTPSQQRLAQTICDTYAHDERILAVVIFGSLGRGNWDAYSDLDLDVVIADGVTLDVVQELGQLCQTIRAVHGLEAVIIADEDEGDVVLSDLTEFSIRYHPLHDTKPAILDSMRLLMGRIPLEAIRAAGEAKRVEEPPDFERWVSQGLRYTLEVYIAHQRGRVWMALELLHRVRDLLMQVYASTQGNDRPIKFMDAQPDPVLHDRLQRLCPAPTLPAIEAALHEAIALWASDLEPFGGGQVQLTTGQRAVLATLRAQVKDSE